jgi:hypothetical protein
LTFQTAREIAAAINQNFAMEMPSLVLADDVYIDELLVTPDAANASALIIP